MNSGALRQTLLTTNAARALTYSHDSRRLIAIVRGAVPMVFNVTSGDNSGKQPREKLASFRSPILILRKLAGRFEGTRWMFGARTFRPMIPKSPRRVQIRLCGCGTRPHCRCNGLCAATSTKFGVWPSVLMASFWPRGARIKRLNCGASHLPPPRKCFKPKRHQTFLFAGGRQTGRDGQISLVPQRGLVTIHEFHTAIYFRAAQLGFSSDGQALVRWRRDGRSLEFISLDSTNQTEVVLEDWGEKLSGLQYQGFSSDWKVFFAIDNAGRVGVWDAATGRVRRHLQGPSSRVSGAAISRSGQWLALASRQEKTMVLVNCDTGVERKLTGHKDVVNGLDFSPDEQLLAGGSLDGTIRLWRPTTGELEATLPGHMEETTDVAFAPDGRTLASVNSGLSVKLWHLATGRELVPGTFQKLVHPFSFVDGRHLAVTTLTNSVILFDAPFFNAQHPTQQ